MRTKTFFGAALVAALSVGAAATDAAAQVDHKISLEGRLGVTFPTGDLSDAGAGSGLSLGADFMYTFTPTLTGYVGLSRDQFSCDEEDGGCADDYTSGGFQGGLKFLLAREGAALPWLRAGVMGHSLDTGGADSDLGLGFEVGGGLDYDVSDRFALVPALHFRSYSPDFPGDDDEGSVNWLNLTLGAHLHF